VPGEEGGDSSPPPRSAPGGVVASWRWQGWTPKRPWAGVHFAASLFPCQLAVMLCHAGAAGSRKLEVFAKHAARATDATATRLCESLFKHKTIFVTYNISRANISSFSFFSVAVRICSRSCYLLSFIDIFA